MGTIYIGDTLLSGGSGGSSPTDPEVLKEIEEIKGDLTELTTGVDELKDRTTSLENWHGDQRISAFKQWSPTLWKNEGGSFTVASYGCILRIVGDYEPAMEKNTNYHNDSYFIFVNYEKFCRGHSINNARTVTWITIT